MTKPEDLDALRRIADRSLEGHSMSAYTLHEAGIEAGEVRNLELEGLVEVRDQDGDPTVALTDAGLSMLTPSSRA